MPKRKRAVSAERVRQHIIENQHLANGVLAQQLGRNPSRISMVRAELRREGLVTTTGMRAAQAEKPPLAYKPAAHKIMQVIEMFALIKGISAKRIGTETGLHSSTVRTLLPELGRNGLLNVRVDPKAGAHYYTLNVAGKKWLQLMEKERKRRDAKK